MYLVQVPVLNQMLASAASNAMSQYVYMQYDMQDSLSWKQVGASSLSSLGPAGMATSSRLGMSTFNWRQVAANEVANGAAMLVGSRFESGSFAQALSSNFTRAVVSQKLGTGHFAWSNILAQTAGGMVSSGISNAQREAGQQQQQDAFRGRSEAELQREEAQRDAAWGQIRDSWNSPALRTAYDDGNVHYADDPKNWMFPHVGMGPQQKQKWQGRPGPETTVDSYGRTHLVTHHANGAVTLQEVADRVEPITVTGERAERQAQASFQIKRMAAGSGEVIQTLTREGVGPTLNISNGFIVEAAPVVSGPTLQAPSMTSFEKFEQMPRYAYPMLSPMLATADSIQEGLTTWGLSTKNGEPYNYLHNRLPSAGQLKEDRINSVIFGSLSWIGGGAGAEIRAVGAELKSGFRSLSGKVSGWRENWFAGRTGMVSQPTDAFALRGACFVPGTLIHSQTGVRPIETIAVGDIVAARNEFNRQTSWRRVLQVFERQAEGIVHVRVQHPNGETETITSTTEHPFFVHGAWWRGANELQAGDQLELLDGGLSVVQNITLESGIHTVHNFEVADDHTYFVGEQGVWVHNTSPVKDYLEQLASKIEGANVPNSATRITERTVITTSGLDEQVGHITQMVPGLEEAQAKALLQSAFNPNKPVEVVIGGSRVRSFFGEGSFRPDSDLDIGFAAKMKNHQIDNILDAFDSAGALKSERGIRMLATM